MRSSTKYSYGELMQDFRHGGENAFNRIFHDLYQALCFYGNTITGDQAVSEEIAAASFLKVWERRGEFQHFLSLKSYLYTTVRNASIDWLRQEKVRTNMHEGMHRLNGDTQQSAFEQLVVAETYRQLHAAIKQLPAKCRTVIKLAYLDGKSGPEIAEELDMDIQTVRSHKNRGVFLLKQRLKHMLPLLLYLLSNIYFIFF